MMVRVCIARRSRVPGWGRQFGSDVGASAVAPVPEALPTLNRVDRWLQFDATQHRYSWRGQPCISVTTLVASLFSKFNADEVVAEHHRRWSRDPNSKYHGMEPHAIKMMWSMNSAKSLQQGHLLHNYIESFFKKRTCSVDEDVVGRAVTDQFHQFHHDVGPFSHVSAERRVVFPDQRLAGTIDLIAAGFRPNSVVLYDWKRTPKDLTSNIGKRFSPAPGLEHLPDTNLTKYSLQLNIYRNILESVYNQTVERMSLVQFSEHLPDGYVMTDVQDLQREVGVILDSRKQTFA